MANSLDLSLPEAPPPRRRGGLIPVVTLLVAVAILVLLVLDRSDPQDTKGKSSVGEAERLERLAKSLEKRTLYLAANEVWTEYMAAADFTEAGLTEEVRAETLYRRGKCLQQGGEYSSAARHFSEVQDLSLSNEQSSRS